MSMCLVNHLDLDPWSWARFLVVVSLPSDRLCLPSPRPSIPPSRVRFPVWWWRARGRLPMWSQAWWSWRTPWPLPLSRKSWCASYPALCPVCMRRKPRAGSNGWAVGETLEDSEEGSQVHGKGEHLTCCLHQQLWLFYTFSVTLKLCHGPDQFLGGNGSSHKFNDLPSLRTS